MSHQIVLLELARGSAARNTIVGQQQVVSADPQVPDFALAEAHRVDEAKEIRNQAHCLAAYARQAQDRDMLIWVTEIKLRAERRTGELLKERAKHPGNRGAGRGHVRPSSSSDSLKLRDLRISPDQNSDWQKLAAIPEPEFEKRLAHAARDPKTMTTAKLLGRPSTALTARGKGAHTPPAKEATPEVARRGAMDLASERNSTEETVE